MTIQKNGVDTAATVANPTVAGSECTWSISGLNIPVVVGDYLEMRFNCTWTIRPTTAYGGTIYIE
jgi:hypothetical protein